MSMRSPSKKKAPRAVDTRTFIEPSRSPSSQRQQQQQRAKPQAGMGQVRWTRRVRAVLSSVANVTGDWFYYFYLIDRTVPNMDNDFLRAIFLVICIASTCFALLNISVKGLGCNRLMGCRRVCGISSNNWASLLELTLEDIPQVVVTVLVSYNIRGPLSSQAVFNLTTSSMNLTLDTLDIFDDFHDDRQEMEDQENNDGDQEAQIY